EGPESGREFTFAGPAISQEAEPREFVLLLKGEGLDLAADVRQTLTGPAARRFQVQKLELLEESGEPGFRVDFSEVLAPAASAEGFVKV
ncbi:hypothetical protein, partial [Klebsiella pneumoniae]|uniref:hypothetical protein n=1 Tax=Klebsiella pneumoniae TaxID=573 RepID=UPI0027315AF7